MKRKEGRRDTMMALMKSPKASPKTPKGQREDSVPDEESEDFRAKDQPSGVIDAQ